MNTRHAVIEGPLGDLTLVADGDALIGLYFRHHWYRPSAFTFGTRVDADSDGLLGETRAQEVSARSRGARRAAGGSTLLMAATNGHKRVDSADWGAVAAELNDFGGALLPQLITKPEAANLRRLYSDDGLFRATIEMANTGISSAPIRSRSKSSSRRCIQIVADRPGLVAQAGPCNPMA